MIASVPRVTPLSDVMNSLGTTMESAMELAKTTGEMWGLREAIKLARYAFETELKPACNAGVPSWVTPAYLEDFRTRLEKAERLVQGDESYERSAGR